MKRLLKTTVAALCLCTASVSLAAAPTTSTAKVAAPKWVFFFKSSTAKIKETTKGKFNLVISNIQNTQIFMLNDRPFYLIRQIPVAGRTVWEGFVKSNYSPNQQVTATLILGNKGQEVILSHFKLGKDSVSYSIKSASAIAPLTATKQSSMELFISADSKPLCNLMNELRHDATSLVKANPTD